MNSQINLMEIKKYKRIKIILFFVIAIKLAFIGYSCYLNKKKNKMIFMKFSVTLNHTNYKIKKKNLIKKNLN